MGSNVRNHQAPGVRTTYIRHMNMTGNLIALLGSVSGKTAEFP
jgi:hypothetical protein